MPATRFALIPLRDLALVVVMFLMLSASVLGQAGEREEEGIGGGDGFWGALRIAPPPSPPPPSPLPPILTPSVNCTVGAADASPSDDAGTLHRCASAGGALVVASAATPVVVPAGLSAEDD